MKARAILASITLGFSLACVHRSGQVDVPHIQWLAIPVEIAPEESYARIPDSDADQLGCKGAAANLPICSVGLPTGQEDLAFRSEAMRLANHSDLHCRNLSGAMWRNLPQVRMYSTALVTESHGIRYYGVGHSYRADRQWHIRIARRITDLNPRSMDQKVRTFRHEVAHTLGASEEKLLGWSAEEYADRCG